jgi:AcrR family transcriptional regulator
LITFREDASSSLAAASDTVPRVSTRVGAPDDDVLEGVRRAVSKFGWHGATLERIAREAGISRVTLHRRGISKASILRSLAERYEADYRDALWPALTSSATGRERLELALRAICSLTEAHLETLIALSDEEDSAFFHERAGEPPASSREFLLEPVRKIVEDGVRDGTLRATDPTESATVLLNVVERTYRHLRNVHGWTEERASRALVDLALRGLEP